MAQKWLQRILLVNDDGIDAPGIKLLEDVAQQLADEVWVVAPATDKAAWLTLLASENRFEWNSGRSADMPCMVLRLIVSRWLFSI